MESTSCLSKEMLTSSFITEHGESQHVHGHFGVDITHMLEVTILLDSKLMDT